MVAGRLESMMAILGGSMHIVGNPSSSHTRAIFLLGEKQLEEGRMSMEPIWR